MLICHHQITDVGSVASSSSPSSNQSSAVPHASDASIEATHKRFYALSDVLSYKMYMVAFRELDKAQTWAVTERLGRLTTDGALVYACGLNEGDTRQSGGLRANAEAVDLHYSKKHSKRTSILRVQVTSFRESAIHCEFATER